MCCVLMELLMRGPKRGGYARQLTEAGIRARSTRMSDLKGNNQANSMFDRNNQSQSKAGFGAASRGITLHILPSAFFFVLGLVVPACLAGSTLNFTFCAFIITALVVVEIVSTTPILRKISGMVKCVCRLNRTFKNAPNKLHGLSTLSRITCCLALAIGIMVSHDVILRLCDTKYLLVLWRGTLLFGLYASLICALKYSWLYR